MSRSEARLSSLVRSVFSASYGEISRRNCREPKGRRDCHVSSPAARVGDCREATPESNFSRRSLRETKESEEEEKEEEVEEAKMTGIWPRKRLRDAPIQSSKVYLAYTGFTETGRRWISSEIGTRPRWMAAARSMRLRSYPVWS